MNSHVYTDLIQGKKATEVEVLFNPHFLKMAIDLTHVPDKAAGEVWPNLSLFARNMDDDIKLFLGNDVDVESVKIKLFALAERYSAVFANSDEDSPLYDMSIADFQYLFYTRILIQHLPSLQDLDFVSKIPINDAWNAYQKEIWLTNTFTKKPSIHRENMYWYLSSAIALLIKDSTFMEVRIPRGIFLSEGPKSVNRYIVQRIVDAASFLLVDDNGIYDSEHVRRINSIAGVEHRVLDRDPSDVKLCGIVTPKGTITYS